MKTKMLVGALLFATAIGAQETKEWNWKGTIADGRTVYLRNVNGEVRIEAGSGNTVEVTAEKRWKRGDPEEVRIEAKAAGNGDGDILICALWGSRARCDEDGYHGNSSRSWRSRDNDVSVRFVVRVPAGVRVSASTVNGGLVVDGVRGDVKANTVNGSIEARSTAGRVEAGTVNGSITVRTSANSADGLRYNTVNGSITIELPADANLDVNLSTVNGRVTSDFPMTIQGTISNRRIQAQLGKGGPELRASTVNGGIRLRKL